MYQIKPKHALSVILFFTFFNVFAYKTPPLPKSNGGGQPGLPVDGGISFLLISGAALGVYTLIRKKR